MRHPRFGVRSPGCDTPLSPSSTEEVRTWRFKPGYRNGVPAPVRLMVEVMFRLF